VSVSAADLALMRRIDEQYLKTPYYGSRRMVAVLRRQGFSINRKHVQRLMRLMGIEAIYPKPNLSRRHSQHRVYPYLLKGLAITRPNQVWCADITYIEMAKGFVYLVVIMDWFSRMVLSWRLSITLDSGFCVEALKEAFEHHGRPEIFNTDQGVQFTCAAFIEQLASQGVRISMDGKGRFLDNIMVERLWRSLKYEEVFTKAYASVAEARIGIGGWITHYNYDRPHQALDYRTPAEIFAAIPGLWICGQSQGALPTTPQAQPPQQERDSHDKEKKLISNIVPAMTAGALLTGEASL
jgi:putative transposase